MGLVYTKCFIPLNELITSKVCSSISNQTTNYHNASFVK